MNQKTTLAIAIAIVGGVAISVASPWNPKSDPKPLYSSQKAKSARTDMETKTYSLSMNASGIKNIKVDIELGSVEISTNSGSSFDAEISKGISRPLGDEERKWLNNPWLKVRREGDTLVVYEDKSLKPDFKRSNRNEKKNNQIDVRVNIQIPSGLRADVKLLAGNAAITGEYHSLSTQVSAGELDLNQVDPGEFLKVNVEAGEVNAKLTRVPSQASSINVSVGEINLDVRGNATIFAKSSIGSISASGKSDEEQDGVGSKQQIKLGSGGTKLTLDVGAGSINVGNGVIEKRSKRDEEDDLDAEGGFQIDIKNEEEIQHEISFALSQSNAEVQREMARADKEAKSAISSIELKNEIARAMKEAKAEINSVDIQKEIAMALKEAKSAINSIDLEDEIGKAMKESKVDIEAALKDADREISKAMREVEIDMESMRDSDGQYHRVSRETLQKVKQILDQTKTSMKRALGKKPAKKKNSHD